MPHFCCVGDCNNSSDKRQGLSFHGLPITDKSRLKLWVTKMRRNPRHFHITKYTKICSAHFLNQDFIELDSTKRRLKKDAVPSMFPWTVPVQSPRVRTAVQKLEEWRREREEETETASEGEGDMETTQCVSRKTQTDEQDCAEPSTTPCHHRFSVKHLLSKSNNKAKEEKLFTHFTGFHSHSRFLDTLLFLVPNLDPNNIVYWGTEQAKSRTLRTSNDFEGHGDQNAEQEDEQESSTDGSRRGTGMCVEDEFLMLLMKLRMGLSNIDLAERFDLSESTVSRKIITWLNYLYVTLGSLRIWPNRSIVITNSPKEFTQIYPNTIVIIDATELQIEVPSSLQKQSETFSHYKSHTTLKSLIGVDPRGGVMFISQLYEGSISDKELVRRSGFLTLLEQKLGCGDINVGDAIMADKGFDIEEELKGLGLKLNIPPFLAAKGSFSESDVIKTQTIATHRIHVERAIGKIRRFQIFKSLIPVAMFGTVNQLWTVAGLLSNFQNPILQ